MNITDPKNRFGEQLDLLLIPAARQGGFTQQLKGLLRDALDFGAGEDFSLEFEAQVRQFVQKHSLERAQFDTLLELYREIAPVDRRKLFDRDKAPDEVQEDVAAAKPRIFEQGTRLTHRVA